MKVIGYIRVSTEEQAREGISLEAQRAKIEAWAKALDGELLGIEEDAGISGKLIKNREGLKRALEVAYREKAVLVVHPYLVFPDPRKTPLRWLRSLIRQEQIW